MATVIIIGGGLAGLTAAFRLSAACEVILVEADSRLGGQIYTDLRDGFVVERGAEGFVARSQAVPALVRDLGLPEGELIAQSTLRSYGFDGEHLLALQPGEAASFLGFQVPVEDLGQGIRSLRRGMGSLISALESKLRGRVELCLGARVTAIEAHGSILRAHVAGQPRDADALVVATSAASVCALLAPLLGEPALALREAQTTSSLSVELAYERDTIEHPLDATGFVVKQSQQLQGLRACTFTSSKFADRAPIDKALLRLFFRPSAEDLSTLTDAAWTERAVEASSRVLPLRGDPLCSWVSRWPNALPVFDDRHRTRVAALEQALQPYAIALAGSAFHGAGIDAAVRSGERALLDRRFASDRPA